MTLDKSRSHLIILGIGTILCAFSLGSIVKYTDPFQAGNSVHLLFFLVLLLLGIGIFTLLGIVIRQRFHYGIYVANLKISVRQACLISALLTTTVFLQGRGLLFWWVEILLILFIIVLEVFFNL